MLLFSDQTNIMSISESGRVFFTTNTNELEVKTVNKINKIDVSSLYYWTGQFSPIPYYSIYIENKETSRSLIIHVKEYFFDEFCTYIRLEKSKYSRS